MSSLHSRLFFRSIAKNREVYLLKVLTLAIAFSCCTLIILFSSNEFGYDRFHADYNSVFRVIQRNNDDAYSGNRLSSRIPFDVFSALKSGSQDSIIVARVKVMDELTMLVQHTILHNQKFYAADPEITGILSFEILDGSLEEFKLKQQTLLLSSSASKRYFGTDRAAGKKLKIHTLGDTLLFSVAAVYKDYPKNSHEEFSCFIRYDTASIQSLKFNHRETGVYVKVLSKEGIHEQLEKINKSLSAELSYEFQAIAEIYFGPRVIGEDAKHGDQYSIVILISITALIFFLAITSFVNLTTLTLPYRSKELAVKKLAGASQMKLLAGFTAESFSLIGISLALGILTLLLTSHLIEAALSINLTSFLIAGDALLIYILIGLSVSLGVAPLFMTLKFTGANPHEETKRPRFGNL